MAHRKPLPKSHALVLMAIIAAAAVSVLAQQHRAQPPRTVRLYIFDCGVIRGLDPALFNFKKEELANLDFAVPCYLVVHPKGTLIWDVGVIPDTAFKADGAPVTQGVSTVTKRLDKQLAEIGYSPSDITYLAHSHYHLDHIANSNEFASSTWLVRQVERDAMFAEKPPALVDPSVYSALKTSKTVIISTDEYDVFGDGKVLIKFAPGHTPGHQVLVVKLAQTGTVLIAGDLTTIPKSAR